MEEGGGYRIARYPPPVCPAGHTALDLFDNFVAEQVYSRKPAFKIEASERVYCKRAFLKNIDFLNAGGLKNGRRHGTTKRLKKNAALEALEKSAF